MRDRSTIDRNLLLRMNELQFHRGPDEGGIHVEAGIGFAHRRLSIIDLSSGQQPLFNEDHSVVVVYNGEIYNFQELAEELRKFGHKFRTHCDTEVIVHAWEEWGENCVKRFRGMFAFAIWDRNKQALFLARDRLGIKPLYYALLPDDTLIFASELKALLIHPKLPRELNPIAIEDYFAYGYVPEPKTILRHAYKLSPGYTLTLTRGKGLQQPKQYWDIPFAPEFRINENEACEELISRFREAVAIRLIAEVPLGAFLSGGVDSSAVVAMMAGLSNRPVTTCSIAFGEAEFDETEFSNKVALRYDTDHQVDKVELNDFDLIDRLATLYDEPYADSSAIPTYRVCELARKRVTVALSGDGGDENFAGYRRYRWHAYEEKMRSALSLGMRKSLFGLLGRLYPKADWAPRIFRAKSTFQALARDNIEGYLHGISIVPTELRKQLFSEAFRRELQGYEAIEVLREYTKHAPTDDPVSLVQYLDMKTYLVGDILTKVDRASMAHGLEVRVPLLDHSLVEWISCLPRSYKLVRGEGKYIFKKSLEAHLSDDILYRKKKGFAVPLASWFRGPLKQRVHDITLESSLGETGIFDESTLRLLLDQHNSGKRDHSHALWSLMMFESFQRQVLALP